MSPQRGFSPVAPRLQMCTQSRLFALSIFCFVFWLLVSPNGGESLHIKKRPEAQRNAQHSLFLHSLLLERAQIARFPRGPSVLKRWRTYSCKAILCLRLRSTKTNVKEKRKKSGENGKAILNICI